MKQTKKETVLKSLQKFIDKKIKEGVAYIHPTEVQFKSIDGTVQTIPYVPHMDRTKLNYEQSIAYQHMSSIYKRVKVKIEGWYGNSTFFKLF